MPPVHTYASPHLCPPPPLQVGTESSLDRSKSIKSHLCRLFTAAGNASLEGVDCIHGCYGATGGAEG